MDLNLDPALIDRTWTLDMVQDANDVLDAVADHREQRERELNPKARK